jgi:hypothetical protein
LDDLGRLFNSFGNDSHLQGGHLGEIVLGFSDKEAGA